MSVQLHPDIETLDKESLCYSIYAQLYHNFFNAQQKKDDEHPYGIEEGDETSLRLKNTAYGFASAIAGAVTGEGGSGSGGLLLDYLKKSGGDMTGKLSANYGFEAGIGNTRILETYSQDITDPEGVVTAIEYGIRITGNLKVGGDSLHIGGRQLLRYDADKATATINASHIDFLDATVDGFPVHDRSLKQPSAEFIDFFPVECVIIRAFAVRIRVPDYVFPQTFIDIDQNGDEAFPHAEPLGIGIG